MEIEQQSTFNNTNNNLIDTEFHDALEEFPFLDASTSFEESYQSVSTSDSDIINDEATETATVISAHSPASPSAAGLRHRRLVSPRSRNEVSQSRFFKKNPEGLIDFDPKGVGKKHKRSCSLKDNEKLNENLSLDSHGSSAITSVSDSQRVHDESTTVDSPNSGPDFLSMLAELVIEVISFQAKLLAKSVKFSIWLIRSSYMLICDPYGVIRLWRNDLQGGISGIWGICYNSCVKLSNWFQTHESALKLCVQIGWGLLWLAYCGFLLVCLLVPAFVSGAVVVKWIVEEPLQITEQLTFDYTKDTPMAFAPVIYCPDSSFVVNDEKSKIGSFAQSRVVPFGHELKAIVSLVLPESDYNRNLGIFQVRVDFLSSDGKLLASTRKPCMLQFKSEPIRLLSTFVKLAYLLTSYPSETQTLDMNFSGYSEKDVPLSCLRVVIEQRAEFAKGDGVPEIYSASLKLETQFPFLKRILWYWKGLIYMWISITLFITELLFTLLCCTPVIFPWVRRAGGSSINTAAHNKPPG
ncbi:putative Seipin family protein [Helianthus annuus]|nr:putative Seipin family protein [Helianthus annuus]